MSGSAQVHPLRRALRHWRWVWRQRAHWESPGRFVLFHLLRALGVNERVSFHYQGARFRLFDTTLTHLMFFHASRWHGALDLRFLRKLLRPGDTIVDIGANIGSHAIPLAKSLGETTQVYAFEPHPRVFAQLQANAALNRLPNLHLYNLALGAHAGEVAFTDVRSDDYNRVAPVGAGALMAPMTPLDCFEPLATTPIDLLKVDVEGYELFVLRGAEATLTRTRFIFLEANAFNAGEYGSSVQALADYLRARGWILYRVVSSERLQRLPEAPVVDEWENWLAVRSEDALRERLTGQGVAILSDDE
ncbi:MAG: FkbM family methyltransferase [Fimbriimonadales bacterium]